jgi:hypothetical protein
MEIWTTAEEATNLGKRFDGVNRKEFAKEHSIPGGDVMIYQHITGRRPMSPEAAVAYARAFHCAIEEISPRTARRIATLVAMIRGAGPTAKLSESSPGTRPQLGQTAQQLVEAIERADRYGVPAEAFTTLAGMLRVYTSKTD